MSELAEDVIDSSSRGLFKLKELWRYRELFYFFTWRDVKIRYKQTVLGFLWVVLQPLLMMLMSYVIFYLALKIPSDKIPYPIYVFSGMLIWTLFANGLTNAGTSMINNATIIKKIYFPRVIIPVSSILVALFDFAIAFGLFVIILLYYQQPILLDAIWAWPLALTVAILSTLGIGSWLAALNVKYRDFRYVIPFMMQVMFFLTPVMYPISMIPIASVKYVLSVSPIYAAIELFRFPITGVPPDQTLLMISLASCVVFLVIGLVYFRKTEDFFADFV